MPSTVVQITSIVAIIGFVINVLVMAVILSRGRMRHHYLFAIILLTAASWDLRIFLIMIRNSFPAEILTYHKVTWFPCILLPAFVYHFTTTYLNKPRKKSTILLYACCILVIIIGTAFMNPGINYFSWGNIPYFGMHLSFHWFLMFNLFFFLIYYISICLSCWFLYQSRKLETSHINQRHIGYIITGFILFALSHVKGLPFYGFDVAFAIPFGILLTVMFGVLIGIAIIKDRLFDITVFVRKGIVYSLLAALIIFIFDFSQHLIAMFLGDVAGEHSTYIHFAFIAVVVIAFMPFKQRLEHAIGGALAKKKIEF